MVSRLVETPQSPISFSDGSSVTSPDSLSSSRGSTPAAQSPATPKCSVELEVKIDAEKKPVKKRKSWGQQLPTPTTNLAPRKRAKTAEEKEQRRVERVLRNRAAAQKSREVKKQQLEKIEKERDDLKKENEILQANNRQLQHQLEEQSQRLERESRKLRETLSGQTMNDSANFDLNETFTLDPNTLLAQDVKTESSLCMTHQPAALVCDLPCLQRNSMTLFSLVWMVSMGYLALSYTQDWACRLGLMLILGWLPLQNHVQILILIRFSMNLLTVIMPLRQRSKSRRSNVALAHLRIATGYNLRSAIALNVDWGRLISSLYSNRIELGREWSRTLNTSVGLSHHSLYSHGKGWVAGNRLAAWNW